MPARTAPTREADTPEAIAELHARLAEAEETLRALRSGQVDALVVQTAGGERIFTLEGADRAYRTLVETMAEGAATLTAQRSVLYANMRLGEMLGLPLDHLVGAPFERLVAAAQASTFADACQAARAGTAHCEIDLVRADGSAFPARVALTTLPPTETAAMSLVVSDLSERKHMEDELRELSRALERRVEQRTRELKATNDELEAFSYSVSHDLRAPLRAIDGFSRAIEQRYADRLDDAGHDMIARVRAAVAKMNDLIEAMLVLSRLSRSELRSEAVDLSALARETVEELRRREPGRDVEVSIDDGLRATGDPELLAVALGNLLENAWKYTRGRAPARIELAEEARSDGRRTFVVRDNGAGFDMAYAEQLFRPFHRLHSEAEFPGTGIGLATVQRIVHRHGGTIRGEGREGEGAAFYFELDADR
jgi:PAS domain S-box-containing protein